MVTVFVLGWRQLMATICERQKHLGLRRRVERVERVSMLEALAILSNLRTSKSGQASGRTVLYRRGGRYANFRRNYPHPWHMHDSW